MADKRRLNLSFSMSSPLQREAWERLFAIPAGQRTEAVCHAVCRMYERDALAETVRAVIREELRGGEIIQAQENTEQRREAGDVDESILGFLLSLQREGDDTD